MRTVPITKLKGDLLLELKGVKLNIVTENSKLEQVQRKRIEAEKSFSERELKVKKREEVNDRLEKKFNIIVGDADSYLESVEKNTEEKRIEIKELEHMK